MLYDLASRGVSYTLRSRTYSDASTYPSMERSEYSNLSSSLCLWYYITVFGSLTHGYRQGL